MYTDKQMKPNYTFGNDPTFHVKFEITYRLGNDLPFKKEVVEFETSLSFDEFHRKAETIFSPSNDYITVMQCIPDMPILIIPRENFGGIKITLAEIAKKD